MQIQFQSDLEVDTLTKIHVVLFKKQVADADDRDTVPLRVRQRPRVTDLDLPDEDLTPVIQVRPILYPW